MEEAGTSVGGAAPGAIAYVRNEISVGHWPEGKGEKVVREIEHLQSAAGQLAREAPEATESELYQDAGDIVERWGDVLMMAGKMWQSYADQHPKEKDRLDDEWDDAIGQRSEIWDAFVNRLDGDLHPRCL